MRRIDIVTAASKLEQAFKESGISEIILSRVYHRQEKEMTPEVMISGFYKYTKYYSSFGPAEKKLLHIFELEGLELPKTLANLVNEDRAPSDSLSSYYRGINYALDYLPKIVEMLKQDNVSYSSSNSSSVVVEIERDDNRALITVILPESEREVSSPERLVKALESIRLFYSVFAKIYDVNDNDLSVAAIDSGSDKSFDFLGAANLVKNTKELLLELWDRIIFYREKKAHERLELVAKSLPILDKIGALEQEGKLGKEQCELLRRSVITGAENFIASGAVLPDFSIKSSYSPRELMAPETKLLVEANEHLSGLKSQDEPQINNNQSEEEEFSEEDVEMLRILKAKRKKK